MSTPRPAPRPLPDWLKADQQLVSGAPSGATKGTGQEVFEAVWAPSPYGQATPLAPVSRSRLDSVDAGTTMELKDKYEVLTPKAQREDQLGRLGCPVTGVKAALWSPSVPGDQQNVAGDAAAAWISAFSSSFPADDVSGAEQSIESASASGGQARPNLRPLPSWSTSDLTLDSSLGGLVNTKLGTFGTSTESSGQTTPDELPEPAEKTGIDVTARQLQFDQVPSSPDSGGGDVAQDAPAAHPSEAFVPEARTERLNESRLHTQQQEMGDTLKPEVKGAPGFQPGVESGSLQDDSCKDEPEQGSNWEGVLARVAEANRLLSSVKPLWQLEDGPSLNKPTDSHRRKSTSDVAAPARTNQWRPPGKFDDDLAHAVWGWNSRRNQVTSTERTLARSGSSDEHSSSDEDPSERSRPTDGDLLENVQGRVPKNKGDGRAQAALPPVEETAAAVIEKGGPSTEVCNDEARPPWAVAKDRDEKLQRVHHERNQVVKLVNEYYNSLEEQLISSTDNDDNLHSSSGLSEFLEGIIRLANGLENTPRHTNKESAHLADPSSRFQTENNAEIAAGIKDENSHSQQALEGKLTASETEQNLTEPKAEAPMTVDTPARGSTRWSEEIQAQMSSMGLGSPSLRGSWEKARHAMHEGSTPFARRKGPRARSTTWSQGSPAKDVGNEQVARGLQQVVLSEQNVNRTAPEQPARTNQKHPPFVDTGKVEEWQNRASEVDLLAARLLAKLSSNSLTGI